MAGEGTQEIIETIQPAVTLLGLGIGSAIVAKAVKLNPIVGYLVLGVCIASLGYADAFSGPVVATLAEAGVMFLLFNLGLHFSLGRIREEAGNIFGFGALQMLIAGGGFAALGFLVGLPPAGAIIGGMALGLSSTAVVIGLIRERDQEDCPVGRAAQSILIFQDIAAILLLVAAGALGSGGPIGSALMLAGAKAIAAFVVAVVFARYLTDPLFRLIGRVNSSEVYTATALFLALAAGWATGLAGLSLTLGAFLGGVAIADSRYRILVQTEIEAFRGLFLGFFFISVGLGIDPAVLAERWPLILAAALALIALKCLFNFLAALANRWTVPGGFQLGFLLGQGSEFALVLFSIPAVAALLGEEAVAILVSAIAVSLAVTPATSELGRKIAGRLRSGPPDEKLAGDNAPVIILNLGEVGRSVADGLHRHGVEYLAIEPDIHRFERALADGYDVHHAALADPRSWEAVNMNRREIVVITEGKMETVRELAPLVEEKLPDIQRIVATRDEGHHDMLEEAGAVPVFAFGDEGPEPIVIRILDMLEMEWEPKTPARAA